MVHVVEVLVAEALDVLLQRDGLLDVLVVRRVAGEDGVVDDHAVDLVVLVGLHDLLLEIFLVDPAEVEIESTCGESALGALNMRLSLDSLLAACLLRPLGILQRRRVIVRQEGDEAGLPAGIALDLLEGVLDLSEQALGDGV